MPSDTSAIFFGTPEFAVPCLRAVHELVRVKLVITQPDRPAGRGMKLAAPPVKVLAQSLGLEVFQPSAVRKPEFAERLRALEADVAVVVAYGRILTKAVLDAPRLGCVNVHGSLLPKFRGAAPIQWAIARGEARTGVCLMQMDEGMDTGDELARRAIDIEPGERAGELAPRLSALGAELLREELPRFLRGELVRQPQDHARATLAPLITKDDGRVDFTHSAAEIEALVRGMHPWPCAFVFLGEQRLKLHRVHIEAADGVQGEAGRVLRADRTGIAVACGRGTLVVDELQPDGKRNMSAAQWSTGLRATDGLRFAVNA